MKRKILFCMVNLATGGAEKSLINLLNELDYNKFDVDLLLFQKKGGFLDEIPENVNLLKIPRDIYYLYNNFFPKTLSQLKYSIIRIIGKLLYCFVKGTSRKKRQYRWEKIFKKNISRIEGIYDVAVAYIECEPTYYIIDKVSANKKIVWVHNDYNHLGLEKEIDVNYFDKADNIITISNDCLKILKEVFQNQSEKILCIPNISSEKDIFKKANQNSDFNIFFSSDCLNILSIGRLNEQKGFDLAIKAAALLKEKSLNFKWIIMGEGELKKDLQDLINKYKLNDNVFLIGSRKNPYPYIKNCDIIAQTSRYEGKSIVLDEAKILNKPILATSYPTVFDQVSEEFGFVVDINENAIFEQLENIILNKEILNAKIKKNKLGNDIKLISKYNQILSL